jgi:serine/threonine-protein kinase
METLNRTRSHPRRALLVFAFIALLPAMPAAVAQPPSQLAPNPTISFQTATQLHADGLAMELRKDDIGAFAAFVQAAQNGYPPAQRKLGDLYGHGTPAVRRDYEESLRWYEMARENGESVPHIESRMPGLNAGP